MAGITLEQAQEQLQLWLNANKAISTGVSYTIGTRSLTRANSDEVLKQIDYWSSMVSRLEAQTNKRPINRIYRSVPLD